MALTGKITETMNCAAANTCSCAHTHKEKCNSPQPCERHSRFFGMARKIGEPQSRLLRLPAKKSRKVFCNDALLILLLFT